MRETLPDLLIAGRYTEDQIWVFGEVIERLAGEIELAARAKLAKLLALSDKEAPLRPTTLIAVPSADARA